MPLGGLLTAGTLAAAAGGSIAAAVQANNAAKAGQAAAASAAQKGVDAISGVQAPSIQEQLLNLQQLKLSGKLTPAQEAIVDQQVSQLNAITTDPNVRSAQMAALTKLQQVGDQGGLTVQDRAQIQEIENSTNAQEQQNRNAILQNAQARGMGGSGLEQAAELTNSQNAATNASNQGMQTAAQAQARALQAITQAGTLGTQIQGQDFSQAATKASAQDAINRFNAANQQQVIQNNTNANNTAQQVNLQRQDLQDTTNNEIANKQQVANQGLYQTQYQDQMDKAKAEAAAYTGQGQIASAAANQNANLFSNLGASAAKIGATGATYGLSGKSNPAASTNGDTYDATATDQDTDPNYLATLK